MSPDDPRHGTNAGYYAHHRAGQSPCVPCRRASKRYGETVRLERFYGSSRRVSSRGVARRLQALAAIGWDFHTLAGFMGTTHHSVANSAKPRRPNTYQSHLDKVSALYDELSMCLPPDGFAASYARRTAAKHGWLPPLAWDDIDNDPEPPIGEPVDLDEVVVERILDGERLDATQEEKAEVVRRWLAAGRPLAHLEAQTGWNGNRERLRATQKGVA